MNHAQKIIAFALLVGVSAAGLVAAQNARNPLFEQYPELFDKARPTVVSFGATW